MMGTLLLSIAYGVDPKTVDHPYILMAEGTIAVAATAGTPGTFLVDMFPWRTFLLDPRLDFVTKVFEFVQLSTYPNGCLELASRQKPSCGKRLPTIALRNLSVGSRNLWYVRYYNLNFTCSNNCSGPRRSSSFCYSSCIAGYGREQR